MKSTECNMDSLSMLLVEIDTYLLQNVLRSKYMVGTDWLLSMNSNFTLDPEHKSILCDFTLHKNLSLELVFPVTVGKCFQIPTAKILKKLNGRK